jgi:NAD(P)-dependent dehydrogenase (short-subunit alcohol dehydrogenase family)
MPRSTPSLAGRRVFITGAARGIGAALAERLHERGAKVALAGLEPELLAETATSIDAPWWACDVTDATQVQAAVDGAAEALGGLDVVVANAGIAAQLPLVGGDPTIFERTMAVNVLGAYYTLRAAGPHVSHPGGYALAVSSLGGVVHVPLMGAYNASKAAVEALGNTLRIEMRPSGARVGVAYFAELDTDMTTRGFATEAARRFLGGRSITRVTPLEVGIDALERGIARRSRRIVAPAWITPLLPIRMVAQRVVDVAVRPRVAAALEIAREERVELTTPQPAAPVVLQPVDEPRGSDGGTPTGSPG